MKIELCNLALKIVFPSFKFVIVRQLLGGTWIFGNEYTDLIRAEHK